MNLLIRHRSYEEFVTISNDITSIGARAFKYCKYLTKIIIPNNVISIDNSAFNCCESLENINVDDTNKNFTDINGILFNKDKTELICYPSGKKDTFYTIPNSVTSIGDRAFNSCNNLKEITIFNDTLTIKKSIFEGTNNLESITIPYIYWKTFKNLPCCYKKITITSAKSIGKGAFRDIPSLEEVSIPNNMIIPESAFENCINLKTFKISENVKTIKDYAFKGCENLEIEVPKTVKTIGTGAFDGVKKVTYLD